MVKSTWSWLLQEPDPPLHEAAKAGDADKVKSLLEAGTNPCEADSRGKVPYDVAADKAVRDAFRRSDLCLCNELHAQLCWGEQRSSRGGAVETCTVYVAPKSSCNSHLRNFHACRRYRVQARSNPGTEDTGWPLQSICTVSRQSLYLLDPPSVHNPSSEKPGLELPTDCL